MTTGDKWIGTYLRARASIRFHPPIRRHALGVAHHVSCKSVHGTRIVGDQHFSDGSFRANDEVLSWGQVRAAGYYRFLVISGLAMTIAGIGIWIRRGWSRWLVVLLYAFPIPIAIIYSRSHLRANGLPWSYGIEAVLWAGFFYWYLFYKQRKALD